MATYDHLLARVRELMDDLERPPVVAIGGHGGAGKSTLTTRLARDLGIEDAQTVGLDALYAATDTSVAPLWGLHDWPALLGLLREARATPTPERLAYRYRYYSGTEGDVDEPMPPVLIVEGIRVLRPETRPLLDLAVWIDLDPATAASRAKARNVLQGDSQAELDLWDTKWQPEGEVYERAVDPFGLADLVIPAEGLGEDRTPRSGPG